VRGHLAGKDQDFAFHHQDVDRQIRTRHPRGQPQFGPHRGADDAVDIWRLEGEGTIATASLDLEMPRVTDRLARQGADRLADSGQRRAGTGARIGVSACEFRFHRRPVDRHDRREPLDPEHPG